MPQDIRLHAGFLPKNTMPPAARQPFARPPVRWPARTPARRPVPEMVSGSALPGIGGASAKTGLKGAGGAGMVGQVAAVGELAVDAIAPDKELRYGLGYKPVGASAAKSGLKGAAMGASLGSVIPGVGTAVGAVVGGAIGLIGGAVKGRKEKKMVLGEVARRDVFAGQEYDRASQSLFSKMASYKDAAYAGHGMALPGMRAGGSLPGSAVILGGQSHRQSGRHGAGNPGIDAHTGEKVVEVEARELLLTDRQTQRVNHLITMHQRDGADSEQHLFELGSLMRVILRETRHQKA